MKRLVTQSSDDSPKPVPEAPTTEDAPRALPPLELRLYDALKRLDRLTGVGATPIDLVMAARQFLADKHGILATHLDDLAVRLQAEADRAGPATRLDESEPEWRLYQALAELDELGDCQAGLEGLIAGAGACLVKLRKPCASTDPDTLAEALETAATYTPGMAGERTFRLNLNLRKWALYPPTGGRHFDAESETGLRKLCQFSGQEVSEAPLSARVTRLYRRQARTIMDYLDAATLAGIVEGRWQGDAPDMRFERVTFGPGRLPGNELLVAPGGGSAHKSHALNPWPKRGILTNKPDEFAPGNPMLVVSSPVRACSLLAHYARAHAGGKFIAVTGSSGKTSTKDMLAHVLSQQMLTSKTGGTSNSLYSTANMLINRPLGTAATVFECGLGVGGSSLNHMSGIIRPHIAVVTSVGGAHAGGYASLEDLARKKLEIAAHLESGGWLMADGDSDLIRAVLPTMDELRDKTVIFFGRQEDCQVRVRKVRVTRTGTKAEVEVLGQPCKFTLPMYGEHWIKMAALTLAVAKLMGADLDKAIDSLAAFQPLSGRGQLLTVALPDGQVTVLDSHFNANPGSMRADLDAYNALAPTLSKGGRKIGFVGAMRELGNLELSSHNELWQWLRESKFSALYLVGKEFQTVEGITSDAATRVNLFDTSDEALAAYANDLRAGDFLFVKGSHSTELAKVMLFLRERESAASAAAP